MQLSTAPLVGGVDDGSAEFQICISDCEGGISGNGPGQFNSPTTIAINSDGDLFISEDNNPRIQIFNSSFQYQDEFGESGAGNGQFSYAYGMVFDDSGDLYLADSSNDRVQKFVNPPPIQISTCLELQAMNQDLTADYELANDIDCSDTVNWNDGEGFEPVGIDGDPFTGSFNGNNYTISDLTIERPGENYVGLFGVADDASFKDFSITGSIEGQYQVGAVVGRSTTFIDLSNITSDVDVSATSSSLGGLIGYAATDGLISSVTVSGDLGGTATTDVGGLLGGGYVSIASSTYSGNIIVSAPGSSVSYIGGFAGYIDNSDSTITDSAFTGNLTINAGDGESYELGGLVGEWYGNLIDNTTMSGTFTVNLGDGYSDYGIGGFVGYTSEFTISNSSFTGELNVNANYIYYGVGGLLGYNDDTVDIINSYSTGDINVTTADYVDEGVGGLAGYYYQGGSISNSYSTSNITINAGTYVQYGVGGLYGYNSDDVTITDSFAQGDINITAGEEIDGVGGLYGYNDGYDVTVDSSYAAVNITLNSGAYIGYVGGFAGENYAEDDVSNSFSASSLSLTSGEDDMYNVGGFNGESFGSTENNFYDKTFSDPYICAGEEDPDPEGCTGIEEAGYFLGNNSSEPMASWDFDDTWSVVAGNYPILQDLPSPYSRVATNAASNITKVATILNGTLNEVTDAPNGTAVGFLWGEDTEYGNTTIAEGDFTSGDFITTITTLTCDTEYHFKAYATVDGENSYGRDKSFTTNSCSDAVPPTFESLLPTVTFDFPTAIAKDSSDNKYVVNYDTSQIIKFNSDGAFVATFGWGVLDGTSELQVCTAEDNTTATCQDGTYGDGDGQLPYPSGIGVDSIGNIWVTDEDNDRITIFNSDLTFSKAIGWGVDDGSSEFQICIADCQAGISGAGAGQFNSSYPEGIDFDSSGNAYVTDDYNNRIQVFDADGNFIKTFGWGVDDGSAEFQTCTADCEAGISGGGAGQMYLGGGGGLAITSLDEIYLADYGNHRIQKFNSSDIFVSTFGWGVDDGSAEFQTCTADCEAGISGSSAGQFFSPTDVAIDSSGNIYVTDYANKRIDKFSSLGTFISAWGFGVSDGSDEFQICTADCQTGAASNLRPGEFNFPMSAVIDSSDNLYIVENNSNRIEIFSSEGEFVGGLGAPESMFGAPVDISHDSSGNIYATNDSGSNTLYKFDSKGNFLFTIGNTDLSNPYDTAVNSSSGVIYVVDGNNLYVYMFNTSDGSLIDYFGVDGIEGSTFSGPYGLTLDDDGNAYVTDQSASIYKFDSDGNFLTSFTDDNLSAPRGIALGPDGNLYVTDYDNDNISIFTTNGTYVSSWGEAGEEEGELTQPDGIAFSLDGTVYITEAGGCRVQAFTSDGDFLFSINGPGFDDNCDSGLGEFDSFNDPQFLDIDASGNLYVPDYSNSRIQKFAPAATDAPAITTTPPTSISKTGAKLNGTISDTGGDNATSRGFIYSTTADYYNHRMTDEGDFEPENFYVIAEDLECNTVYHYRAFATNSIDTIYGADTTFTTDKCSNSGSGGASSHSPKPIIVTSTNLTYPTDCAPGFNFSPSTGRPCPPLQTTVVPGQPVCNGASITQTLKLGMKGNEVKCLQTILKLTSDGIFGPKTKAAVIIFQSSHNLTPDGVVGPKTRGAMGFSS